MQSISHNQDEAVEILSDLVGSFSPKYEHWINGTDEGDSWCKSCATFKIKHLRKHNYERKNELRLDGGWCTDADSAPYCKGCFSLLDHNLSDSMVEEEIVHYSLYGLPDSLSVSEVWCLLQLLNQANTKDGRISSAIKTIKKKVVEQYKPLEPVECSTK